MSNNLEVWIEISVKDDSYDWSLSGKAKAVITLPENIIDSFDPGNLVFGLLQSAKREHHEKIELKELNKDDENES
jgi:hypothetical protein